MKSLLPPFGSASARRAPRDGARLRAGRGGLRRAALTTAPLLHPPRRPLPLPPPPRQQGVDLKHGGRQIGKKHRTEPKSDNVYVKLLHKVRRAERADARRASRRSQLAPPFGCI
jgi:hypothetical protein